MKKMLIYYKTMFFDKNVATSNFLSIGTSGIKFKLFTINLILKTETQVQFIKNHNHGLFSFW